MLSDAERKALPRPRPQVLLGNFKTSALGPVYMETG